MFGKEENISTKRKDIGNDVSHLMSGKSYSDENFPVASFLMTKKIRSEIVSAIEKQIKNFTNSKVISELKLPFSEGIKNVSDSIYCLFENILGGLTDTIGKFLKKSLLPSLSKFTNSKTNPGIRSHLTILSFIVRFRCPSL